MYSNLTFFDIPFLLYKISRARRKKSNLHLSLSHLFRNIHLYNIKIIWCYYLNIYTIYIEVQEFTSLWLIWQNSNNSVRGINGHSCLWLPLHTSGDILVECLGGVFCSAILIGCHSPTPWSSWHPAKCVDVRLLTWEPFTEGPDIVQCCFSHHVTSLGGTYVWSADCQVSTSQSYATVCLHRHPMHLTKFYKMTWPT